MIDSADGALKFAYHAPKGVPNRGRSEEYFVPFGYTIYRTAYDNAAQDQVWEFLLERLDADLKQDITHTFSSRQHIESERQNTEKLKSLARIEGRSDQAVLNNCSVEQLRTIFENRVGGAPLNADAPWFPYFLFADREVLEAAARGEHWVKIGEVYYENLAYDTENHPRLRQKQTYWGWMKVATGSLFYTRCSLEFITLYDLAMTTRGFGPSRTDDLFPIMDDTMVVDTETRRERVDRLRAATSDPMNLYES